MNVLCAVCGRPSQAYLCDQPNCGPALESDLALTPWLDVQLTTERARLGVKVSAGHRHAGTNPLGYAPAAARCQDALRNTVTTWARDLLTVPRHVTSTGVLAELLLRHAGDIRLHPAAGEIARDFERCRKWALRVINPTEDGMTYGICGAQLDNGDTCPAYLYGELHDPHASWVRCRACRTQHATAERRETMRRRMEVLYLRAATLARIIPLVLPEPRPVSADLIRAWWRAGKPIRVQHDADGYPTYHCGDAVTVALASQHKRAKQGSAV